MKNLSNLMLIFMVGISFGILMTSCKKKTTLPVVATESITGITSTSALSGGNVKDDGNAKITERGVCWSEEINPEISDNKTNDGSGTGSYASSISGLSDRTTYHVRAYATNSEGTAYGQDISFETLHDINKATDYSIALAADIPVALSHAGLNSKVVNNCIYIFGGVSGPEPYSNHVYKYTTTTNTWTDLGSILPYGTRDHSNNVAAFSSTTFYLAPSLGPYSYNGWGQHKEILEFNLNSNTISLRASYPINSWHISPVVHGDIIYMFQRHTGSDHKEVFRYLPATNFLTNMGDILPYTSSMPVAVKVQNGDIILFGGRSYKRSLVIFDPLTETVKYNQESFLPFDLPGGYAWTDGNFVFLINPATGKIYEFNITARTLAESKTQIFTANTQYYPMISKDESTGIVYLISGTEGNQLIKTVRRLTPMK